LDLIVGHSEDLVVEFDHLHQVDDDANQEHHHESCRKIVVALYEKPEHHAEEKKDIEWLDDLEQDQVDDRWLANHHRPWAVGFLQF
jgi:hypothetical protein